MHALQFIFVAGAGKRADACNATLRGTQRRGRQGPDAFRERCCASAASSPAGTDHCTIPSRQASKPSTTSPASTIRAATPGPHSRASRWVPPAPGINPRRVSGRQSRATFATIPRSHANASSKPPPSAAPPIFASVTQGRLSMRSNRRSIPRTSRTITFAPPSIAKRVSTCARSAPAQNAFWSLRRCITVIPRRPSTSSRTRSRPVTNSLLRALTGARCMVIRTTLPCVSTLNMIDSI